MRVEGESQNNGGIKLKGGRSTASTEIPLQKKLIQTAAPQEKKQVPGTEHRGVVLVQRPCSTRFH